MSELLINDRDPRSANEMPVDWHNWNDYLQRFVTSCHWYQTSVYSNKWNADFCILWLTYNNEVKKLEISLIP